MSTTLDLTADIIDVRDIIARVEELADQMPEDDNDVRNWFDSRDYFQLTNILHQLAGNGGDEKWRGEWYPLTLIRDSYFKEYAQELAEDIGAIYSNASWPNRCIDWDQAAYELQMDYTKIEIDGSFYWYR